MKLLIKQGIIVTADKTFMGDIFCVDGVISEIGENLQPENVEETIDASGRLIFPGGIDPHVHMHLPTKAGYSSDDFLTGSKAAIFGGTTTLIDFVTPHKGQSLTKALEERKKEALSSIIDYSFHVSPIEWRSTTEEEIRICIQEKGITSFKIYMAYKNTIGLEDKDILSVMEIVSKYGGIVTMHCELGDDIEELRNSFAKNKKLKPKYHPLSRPAKMESKAVKKAIKLASKANCPLYIVHVSSKKSIKHIKKAQQKGQKVFAETCPQYLLLDDSKYLGEFNQTAPFIMSPPLRKSIDNTVLWQSIIDKEIQTIGTDHCPFMMNQKKEGKNDFRKIPNGSGGIEHRLSLLYTYGVIAEKITLNQFVNISSTNAAKIFGLYPQKGEIAIGSDADLIVWDPNIKNIISVKTHNQNCDSNIYEGVKTKGAPQYVIRKGEIIIKDGDLISNKSKGQFLSRS